MERTGEVKPMYPVVPIRRREERRNDKPPPRRPASKTPPRPPDHEDGHMIDDYA